MHEIKYQNVSTFADDIDDIWIITKCFSQIVWEDIKAEIKYNSITDKTKGIYIFSKTICL